MSQTLPVSIQPCSECGVGFLLNRTNCPHCGRPQHFPNVRLAQQPGEVAALDARYDAARQAAVANGTDATLRDFEAACAASEAVLCCKLEKLLPIARRERDLFANYSDLLSLSFQKPHQQGEPNWATLRPQVEIELLGGKEHHERLHYACLTLNGAGLPHYGNCEILFRPEMVAHRISTFESNSAVHEFRHPHAILPGMRTDWGSRARLCVAKLGSRIDGTTTAAEYPALLMKRGATGLDDEFVELHLFGELTFHAFARLRYTRPAAKKPTAACRPRTRRASTEAKPLRDYCAKMKTDGKEVEYLEC